MTHAFAIQRAYWLWKLVPGTQASKHKIWMRTFFPNVAKLARLTAFISTTKRSTKKLNYNLLTNFFSSIWITKKPFWVYKHFNKRNTLPRRVLIYILKCICVIHVVTTGIPTSSTPRTSLGEATPTLNGKLKSVSCVMKIFVKYFQIHIPKICVRTLKSFWTFKCNIHINILCSF